MNELIMPHNVGVKNAVENMKEVLALYKKVIGNYRPLLDGERYRCHGDWSMASPPTCQEVIDVTSTRPLSKDFDVKRFGLNTTSRIKAFVFRFVSIPAKRIRTSNANAIIHSSFFIYSIIWGKDSENLRTSQI